ncbi:hypothetical protein JBE04_02105 [Streptomyces sp. PRKS01-29]|nr:DNA translocase FtsK [Streptomyces sabulosicollis]MBI0293322.1 hypothetical protein [Streptomyces sabulosicollis]
MTDLLFTATRMVTETRFASPSMLVRRLKTEHGVRITFDTARNLLDQMHDAGIVGPEKGSLARDIVMDDNEATQALKSRWGGDWTHPRVT